MACHRQVRAGDRLTNEEIAALIGEMGKTRFAGQCPHGRPSVLEVPFDEIEKWFKRRL
jgi:DNA mismatch repair protein MutL